MVMKWITSLALCATIVGLSGSFAHSQNFPTPRNGDALFPQVQGGGTSATIRAPLGDPPALPGQFGQPNQAQQFGRQPAAVAPRLTQPQAGNTNQQRVLEPSGHGFGHSTCPYGSNAGYACGFEAQARSPVLPRSFGDETFGRPFRALQEPPIPAGFHCEGGFCPLENQFGRRPVQDFRP